MYRTLKQRTMITRAEVIEVAKDLNINPTEEQILYAIRFYEAQAEDDPTGYWELWVEALLYDFDPNYSPSDDDVEIELVFAELKKQYIDSDVTSGEFIHTALIPEKINFKELNEYHVIRGIQTFLDWDESEERFSVIYDREQKAWVVNYELDTVTFDGVEYPVRTFDVNVIDGDYEARYMVAPERLIEAIQKKEGDAYLDGETEGWEVDSEIYHYVEDTYFYESAKLICEKYLDIPMKLIEEII